MAGAPLAGLLAIVLSVGDGDTLRVRAGAQTLVVRLACIDAPEIDQSPWGAKARAYLQQRLPRGRQVTLVRHGTDRYGRTVAEVITDLNINLVMVEDGQAFAYRQHLASCAAQEYLDAEFRASRRRYGVWQVQGGITRPWTVRRARRSAGASQRRSTRHNEGVFPIHAAFTPVFGRFSPDASAAAAGPSPRRGGASW